MHGGYNYRKCVRILLRNGWVDIGSRSGGHRKFVKDGRHISIPAGKDVCMPMFDRLCKENNIRR